MKTPEQAAPVIAAEAGKVDLPPAADAPSENSKIAQVFKQKSFWLIVSFFFGAGLLLALTPCVFPMIPILSGIIVGRGHQITKMHGFLLSLAYVLGMALTYAAVGVAAGLSGSLLSNALQTPAVLGSFAAVFVLLSLSMFGFYELATALCFAKQIKRHQQPSARRSSERRVRDGRLIRHYRQPVRGKLPWQARCCISARHTMRCSVA